jgi:hypothetical protein
LAIIPKVILKWRTVAAPATSGSSTTSMTLDEPEAAAAALRR